MGRDVVSSSTQYGCNPMLGFAHILFGLPLLLLLLESTVEFAQVVADCRFLAEMVLFEDFQSGMLPSSGQFI